MAIKVNDFVQLSQEEGSGLMGAVDERSNGEEDIDFELEEHCKGLEKLGNVEVEADDVRDDDDNDDDDDDNGVADSPSKDDRLQVEEEVSKSNRDGNDREILFGLLGIGIA